MNKQKLTDGKTGSFSVELPLAVSMFNVKPDDINRNISLVKPIHHPNTNMYIAYLSRIFLCNRFRNTGHWNNILFTKLYVNRRASDS